jgi:excisionase family DNA binding protein
MPRARLKKLPVPIIAASPAVIADLFSVRPDDIARAIEQGLPSYRVGNRRRILIEDVKHWLRSKPQGKVVSHAR